MGELLQSKCCKAQKMLSSITYGGNAAKHPSYAAKHHAAKHVGELLQSKCCKALKMLSSITYGGNAAKHPSYAAKHHAAKHVGELLQSKCCKALKMLSSMDLVKESVLVLSLCAGSVADRFQHFAFGPVTWSQATFFCTCIRLQRSNDLANWVAIESTCVYIMHWTIWEPLHSWKHPQVDHSWPHGPCLAINVNKVNRLGQHILIAEFGFDYQKKQLRWYNSSVFYVLDQQPFVGWLTAFIVTMQIIMNQHVALASACPGTSWWSSVWIYLGCKIASWSSDAKKIFQILHSRPM